MSVHLSEYSKQQNRRSSNAPCTTSQLQRSLYHFAAPSNAPCTTSQLQRSLYHFAAPNAPCTTSQLQCSLYHFAAPTLPVPLRNSHGSCNLARPTASCRPHLLSTLLYPNTSGTQFARTHCSFLHLPLTVNFHDSYSSLINTIWVIKQGGGCGLGTWYELENTEMQTLKERDDVEDLRVVRRTTLRLNLQ